MLYTACESEKVRVVGLDFPRTWEVGSEGVKDGFVGDGCVVNSLLKTRVLFESGL